MGCYEQVVSYWLARVFKPKSVRRGGEVYTAAFYLARFQYAGKRIAMSLGTANQSTQFFMLSDKPGTPGPGHRRYNGGAMFCWAGRLSPQETSLSR